MLEENFEKTDQFGENNLRQLKKMPPEKTENTDYMAAQAGDKRKSNNYQQ